MDQERPPTDHTGASAPPPPSGDPPPDVGYPPPGPGYPPPGAGYGSAPPPPGPGYAPPGYGYGFGQSYGYGPPPPPPGYPPIPPEVDPAYKDKRLAAGLCGILIGQFGVHKFVMGYKNEGIVMAVAAGIGWLLFFLGTVLSVIIIGVILLPFVVLPMVTGIIGLIEGIIYLTKSDYDFVMTYGVHRKAWF